MPNKWTHWKYSTACSNMVRRVPFIWHYEMSQRLHQQDIRIWPRIILPGKFFRPWSCRHATYLSCCRSDHMLKVKEIELKVITRLELIVNICADWVMSSAAINLMVLFTIRNLQAFLQKMRETICYTKIKYML